MTQYRPRFFVLATMIVAAAASRLIPHPWDFTPIGALALFGGACFTETYAAFLVPISAMFLSDLAIGVASGNMSFGLHPLIPVDYGAFALIVCLGLVLRRRRRPGPIAAATLGSSLVFFAASNFGVWALGSTYSKTLAGLMSCYAAALPFLRNAVFGDAVYATALFGGLALLERGFPVLRERRRAMSR